MIGRYGPEPIQDRDKPLDQDWIWTVARDNGFVTLFGEESCENSIKKFFSGHHISKDKWKELFDVTFVDMFCDNNLINHQDNGPIWKKGSSCLGGKKNLMWKCVYF
jgi:hypothetical protein